MGGRARAATGRGRARATGRVRAWIDELADETEEEIVVCDGLDEALVGVTCYQPGRPVCAVYRYAGCVRVLVEQGMSEEEAVEYVEFNTVGAWVGDRTPVFVRYPEDEL